MTESTPPSSRFSEDSSSTRQCKIPTRPHCNHHLPPSAVETRHNALTRSSTLCRLQTFQLNYDIISNQLYAPLAVVNLLRRTCTYNKLPFFLGGRLFTGKSAYIKIDCLSSLRFFVWRRFSQTWKNNREYHQRNSRADGRRPTPRCDH